MIGQILKILFICIIVVLILWWFITGGVSRVIGTAQNIGNPVSLFTSPTSSITTFQLPWRSTAAIQGPDISEYVGSSTANGQDGTSTNSAPAGASGPSFGDLSPYANQVHLTADAATAASAGGEYVTIAADSGNATPVDLTGWSLMSALTGVRVLLPKAAAPFVSGMTNDIADVMLKPGARAIVTSGVSPIGASFQENACSGYLGQHQSFTPPLSTRCPDPLTTFSAASANTLAYGSNCADFIQTLPSCSFPSQVRSDLNNTCKQYIITTFSYNGCVQAHKNEANFARPSWRLYLGAGYELWNNTHDVIKLLDPQGLTVDVATY